MIRIGKDSSRLCRIFWLIGIIVLLRADASAQNAFPYYSPVDSVIYLQFYSFDPPNNYIIIRVSSGGERIERTLQDAPGLITTSVRTPGWLFSKDNTDLFVSHDYGETWETSNGPHYQMQYYWSGRPGENEGESFIETVGWIFHTQSNWETYDSLLALPYDSMSALRLSYINGLIYSKTIHERRITVSSDTGHTWGIGSVNPVLPSADVPIPGAEDELWGRWPGPYEYFYMLTDTGRTADSILAVHPPSRPSAWWKYILPSGYPGEVYIVAVWIDFVAVNLELIVYHIQDYGSEVDSFYYFLPYFEVVDSAEPPVLPENYRLSVYPNPFNSFTSIQFYLPNTTHSSLRVYNLLGREVAVLFDEVQPAGEHTVRFDGAGLSSGLFFYRLSSGDLTASGKMLLIK